jgi:ABC-type amino acid transport substrate-binding protein
MQATAERDEQVDFTIPYRMTKDAFVGAGDSTLVIEKPEDAAGKSIGAQTGTVQEGWIQDTWSLPASPPPIRSSATSAPTRPRSTLPTGASSCC